MLIMLIVPVIVATTFWILLRNPDTVQKHYFDCQCDRQDGVPLNESADWSISDRIHFVPSLFKYMIPLFLIFLFEYFINQGLVSMR